MPRVYATPADLEGYPGGSEVPAEAADLLLQVASRLVDQALVGRKYPTDADGYPTGDEDAEALMMATCVTALELHARGALEAGSSSDEVWDSVSIGSVRLSGRQSDGTDGTVDVFGLPVPPVAVVFLADVGIPAVRVRS